MTHKVVDKMAVIFHGITGGLGDRNGVGEPVDLLMCSKTIKHNIFSIIDCDIFVHSWSVDNEVMINDIYRPKVSVFQPQEYFGYNSTYDFVGQEGPAQGFRLLSRYTSLERAVNLKKAYEIEHSFEYKWVIILRFDLVFFTKLDLFNKDPNLFYICSEPHWPDIKKYGMVHDILFLSSSENINVYSKIAEEIRNGVYKNNNNQAHVIAYNKLRSMFKENFESVVKFGFNRYDDVEISRLVLRPELNVIGHQYGALSSKSKLDCALREIEWKDEN